MNIKIVKWVLISTLSFLLLACAAQKDLARVIPPPVKVLTAMGYGTVDKNRFLPAQRRLMGMRAAKMEAYRALAEQIYGVRLNGNTTVESMVVKNDMYRSYIDAVVRGARVKSITAIDADTYETVMEIELTPHFYDCVGGSVDAINRCLSSAQGIPLTEAAPDWQVNGQVASGCNALDCYAYPDMQGFAGQEKRAGFMPLSLQAAVGRRINSAQHLPLRQMPFYRLS